MKSSHRFGKVESTFTIFTGCMLVHTRYMFTLVTPTITTISFTQMNTFIFDTSEQCRVVLINYHLVSGGSRRRVVRPRVNEGKGAKIKTHFSSYEHITTCNFWSPVGVTAKKKSRFDPMLSS